MWRGTYGREVPGRVTEDIGKNGSGPRTRVSQGWLKLLPSSELRLFPQEQCRYWSTVVWSHNAQTTVVIASKFPLQSSERGGVVKRCPLSSLEGWSPAPRQASSQWQIHIFWLRSAPGFGRKFYSNFYVLVLARSSVFHLVGGWEWESSWVLHNHPLFIQLHPSCPHVSSQSNLSAITWAALCVILSGNTLRH